MLQDASVVKLGPLHGSVLRCQWTNKNLSSAYSVPRLDEKGNFVRDGVGHIQRRGSFADGAAAAAMVQYLLSKKKISEDLANRYMRAIHRDFGLENGEEVPLAPFVEATRIGDPLEYQRFCPKMMPTAEQMVTVAEVEAKREKKGGKGEMAAAGGPTSFYSVEANTELPSLEEKVTKVRRNLSDYDYLECHKKVGGMLMLLHRKGSPDKPNKPVSDLMGEPMMGDYLVLSSKALPSSVLSTRSSTSSTRSSSSKPTQKKSKRTSSKGSSAAPSSSSKTESQSVPRSSRKRSATSAGLPEVSTKRSRVSKKQSSE